MIGEKKKKEKKILVESTFNPLFIAFLATLMHLTLNILFVRQTP